MDVKKPRFNPSFLRAVRKRRHQTQQQVAEGANVSIRTYERWESGDSAPHYKNALALAAHFDLDIVLFFDKASQVAWENYQYHILMESVGETSKEARAEKESAREDAITLRSIPSDLTGVEKSDAQKALEDAVDKGNELMEEGDSPVEGL